MNFPTNSENGLSRSAFVERSRGGAHAGLVSRFSRAQIVREETPREAPNGRRLVGTASHAPERDDVTVRGVDPMELDPYGPIAPMPGADDWAADPLGLDPYSPIAGDAHLADREGGDVEAE
jgi:hypothetical protein